MTAPVPAHGEPQHFGAPAPEQHHPAPGFAAPGAPAYAQGAPAVLDYTGGTEVKADDYATAAADARRDAELAAREQLAEQPHQTHPDDQRREPVGQVADDMRAEVDAELAEPTVERSPAPEGSFEVTLSNKISGDTDTIRILDPNDWPSAANSALHVGEYESWAEGCLAPGDYESVWLRINPSLGDVNRMFQEWRQRTGRDAGKSTRSPASLRRAARR